MMLRRRIGSWGHMRLFGAEDDIDIVATFTPREQAEDPSPLRSQGERAARASEGVRPARALK
jgi:hypothetical protein